jgi:hypothetical protein
MTYSLATLKAGIQALDTASLDDLRAEAFLVDVLHAVGLTKDPVRNEGNLQWQIHDTDFGGINQTPEQFAPAWCC